MSDDVTELQARLDALLKERAEIKEYLSKVKEKEGRLNELNDGWSRVGEINRARLAIRNAGFPIWKGDSYSIHRIIDVDDKWITIRYDMAADKDVIRYKRDTGQKERTRGEWHRIDAAKAVRIWEEYQKSKK